MAIALGRTGTLDAGYGAEIISVTKTDEAEAIDVSHRGNTSGGYRIYDTGLTSTTYEVECYNAAGAVASLTANGTGLQVMGISESGAVDGVVTYTITVRDLGGGA